MRPGCVWICMIIWLFWQQRTGALALLATNQSMIVLFHFTSILLKTSRIFAASVLSLLTINLLLFVSVKLQSGSLFPPQCPPLQFAPSCCIN